MNTLITDLYDYDLNDKTFVIKISPDNYIDIFNTLDHYPIKKRDIDQHVIEYIEDCSHDIPLRKKIKIEIQFKLQSKDAGLEDRTKKGIINHFNYFLEIHKRSSNEVIGISIFYMAIFFILTTLTFKLETLTLINNKIFFKTILQGLSIGSWVFLWEAIAGLLIKNNRNRYMINTYKRLLKSSIYFLYQNNNSY